MQKSFQNQMHTSFLINSNERYNTVFSVGAVSSSIQYIKFTELIILQTFVVLAWVSKHLSLGCEGHTEMVKMRCGDKLSPRLDLIQWVTIQYSEQNLKRNE